MRYAWPGWWLGLILGVAVPAVAQEQPPPAVELRDNYPNPFFPATTIPFVLRPELCDGGHQPVVTLEIYNVLAQTVAIPVLQVPRGDRINQVRLGCGEFLAYWDGRYSDGQREVTVGIYYYVLTVDGRKYVKKMIAQRDGRKQR